MAEFHNKGSWAKKNVILTHTVCKENLILHVLKFVA